MITECNNNTSKGLGLSMCLLISLFYCCQKKENFATIEVNNAERYESLILNDDVVKTISLNISDSSSFLGLASKIQISENRVFIQDSKLHQIFIFSKSGELINSIRASGEGPREFKFIEAFELNQEAQEIVLFDSRTFKILFFDYEGNFLRETKSTFAIRSLTKINQGWLASNLWKDSNDFPDYIYHFNENFDDRKGLRNQSMKFSNLIANSSPFSSNKDVIHYNEPLSNEIYKFSNEEKSFKKLFIVDFSPNPLPNQNNFKSIRDFHVKISKSNYRGWIRDLKMLGDEFLIFKYIQYHETTSSNSRIFIRKGDQSVDFKELKYKGLKIPFPKVVEGNKLFSIVSAEDYKNQIDSSPSIDQYWEHLFDSNQTMAVFLEFELPNSLLK